MIEAGDVLRYLFPDADDTNILMGVLPGDIVYFIFLENHWLFTAHYVRVASLFRLLFKKHTEGDLRLMQRRNNKIKVLTISMTAVIVINCCLLLAFFDDDDLTI